MRYLLPIFEESAHPVSVNGISRVGADSLLFPLSLKILLECLHAYLEIIGPNFHLKESLHATHVLLF